MTFSFTQQEISFLSNILLDRRETHAPNSQELDTINELILTFVFQDTELDQKSIGYLQYILQEQLEINGSRRSVANEKKFMGPGTLFVPTQTLVLIKSITDKLGAHLLVDTSTKSDQTTGRQEGSTWIMKDPTLPRIG